MATGASNLAAQQMDVFSVALVPKSANISYGHVVVFTSDSGDNKIVDIPTAATALLGGRAFAGISCGQGTTVAYTTTGGDQNVQIQRHGIAKCLLKASTACVRGGEAAYDPIDGGTVVPYTSSNQVKIGEFRQSKSSSASAQLVEVLLDAGSTAMVKRHLGGIVADATNTTNVDTEQTFTDATQTIKANSLVAGSFLDIVGLVVVTNQNGADQLTVKVKFGSTVICAPAAWDPGTGDMVEFRARVKIRTIGAAGTWVAIGESNRSADNADPTRLVDRTDSTAIDTTAATTVSVTGQWNAASANNVAVVRMLDVFHTAPSA